MPREPGSAALVSLGLDRSVAEPLYRQLYGQLRDAVLAGRLGPGARLPARRALAAELGAARITVVAAYDQLTAEGFIEARRGAGTFVARDLPPAGVAAPHGARMPAAGRRRGAARRGAQLAAVMPRAGAAHRAFVPGLPAIEAFPRELWARLLGRSWRGAAPALPGHDGSADHAPLLDAIAAHLGATRAVRCAAHQVVLVSGSQQAIGLAAQVLMEAGERVLVEEPGYPGLRGALIGAGLTLVPVPVDDEGLAIGSAAARAAGARLACVAPSHQYPLGVTMSLTRRLALLEWAARRDAFILEDDYDSEFRYAGRPLAALQGLDEDGRVIYVGSFSKVLFPALRLAYLVVPSDLVETFRRARAALGDHPSSLAQPALARFIAEGHLGAHVRRMRRLYARRQAVLAAAAARHLAGLATVAPHQAGMHLLARLTPALAARMDDRTAACLAAAHGITAPPLADYYWGRPGAPGLLLGYAAVPEAEIEPAVRRLATALGC